MCDDDDDIFMTAQEAKEAMEQPEKKVETNSIKTEFEDIITDYNQIEYLLKILIKAVKNEFEEPTLIEIDEYLSILYEYFNNHKTKLKNFSERLPDGKAKLISLKYKKFRD